ncbi:MAG: AmmeMemoRadiSam system protein B [Acidobacteria bacterium]|nr:AmmeMemoRadiSam system protein B [Acidobacteriota bacterium]
MIREPAVAGRFYPANPRELKHQIEQLLGEAVAAPKLRALGCVVPHAGYMYSGHVAGAVFRRLELPSRYIILCPRHFREGQPVAIMSEGSWRTPLGEAKIDSTMAVELKSACALLREDSVAHRMEHSLEVQLPFLQQLAGDFQFVPIALGTDRFGALEELGRAIGDVVAQTKEAVLLVASSDMNHYESDDVTRFKDRKAIDKILELDARGLYDTVRHESITMCGFGPAVTMLTAARQLGATRAEVIRYATSGDITGDREEVVGYAGIAVM